MIAITAIWVLPTGALAQQSDPEKLIEAGHWKKARTVVEARLRHAPDDALGIFLLSQIRNAFGDYTAPEPLAEKAIAMDGRVAKFHRQFAEVIGVKAQRAGPLQILFLARRFRPEIDTAIALDPQDLQALRDLMEFYLLAPGIGGGDPRKAAATAERIGEIDAPEGFLARARVASFHQQYAQAGTFLRKAAEAQPPSYRARLELAHWYVAKEHSDPAVAEIAAKEAMKPDPSRAGPYNILAEIYAGRSAWSELEALLAEAALQNPDDLAPYYRAASTLLAGGRDPARATGYLRKYLSQEPEGNEPSLADARQKLRQATEARQAGAAGE